MDVPTKDCLAQAVRDGAGVRMGLPVEADMGDGTTAALNLAAVWRNEPDPWYVTRVHRELVEIASSSDRGLFISGLRVSQADLPNVEAALRLAPTSDESHASSANQRRMKAGEMALAIGDSMVRARVLDYVDGWSALAKRSKEVDRSSEGLLLKPNDDTDFECMILVVRCPSTGRVYALKVPPHKTAKEARRWVMQACEVCGITRARRRCVRCERMVCSRCGQWAGSSRSVEHGPIEAYCVLDDDTCAFARERDALKEGR